MKRGITMKMKNYPGRITKREARKRWKEGKDFIIVPCRCRPYDNSKELGFMAHIVRTWVTKGIYDNFDDYCNEFSFYNCTAETGYYPAFYLPKEELK